MNKNIIIKIFYFLFILVGIFLLTGAITLKVILASELTSELFSFYIDRFNSIYYSIIPYKMNIFIMFCVPFIDLLVIIKLIRCNKKRNTHLWTILLMYTSFLVLRLTTLQA